MKIQRRLQPFLMNVIEKEFWIGEEDGVPGVAAPTEPMAGLVGIGLAHRQELLTVEVPVHVDDQHVERYPVLVEAFQQVLKLLDRYRPSNATTKRRERQKTRW